ncbi:ATP-binding protein [Streptomyces sp. MBT42]|uniref:ATP-binding protein n=1 Tax=Streptomyces sp. MBT42 TaxID=1488373 RepID=UPI001E49AD04|nr:ATP-binding protein [Streptomyces sp. MBT42]MCD2468621.1 ATP-binding protein [Streptomyces sp. MBT42]
MDRIESLGSIIDVPEHHKSLTLVADDRAPAKARSFTRDALTLWGLNDVLDDAVLIVSELTTNAERHGRVVADPQLGPGSESDHVGEITLTLAAQARYLGIAVEDDSPEPPAPHPPSLYATGGRGLLLVSATADTWCAFPKEDGTGKRVVALVRLPEPSVTS